MANRVNLAMREEWMEDKRGRQERMSKKPRECMNKMAGVTRKGESG